MAQRGEIWSRHAGEDIPDDLVLIISDNHINDETDFVICLLITTTHYGLSSHIEVPPGQSGQEGPVYIQCEEIYKSPGAWLTQHRGTVTGGTVRVVEDRLRDLLDL